MIEAHALTKRYGAKLAVDDISFTVRSGRVTGFLGPNGAGKSTTMRMIVGLDRPTAGTVTVAGQPYARLRSPLTEVGALLEAKAIHPGATARNHLRGLAATHRIPRRRVDEVIDMTGLAGVAGKRVGGFSLGMGQRLGIAAALLGDPHTLILDEPVNGLDPEGVKWVRTMVRYLASEGRTVFLSSHLMSEMAITADDLIVIGRGRILTSGTVQDVIASSTGSSVAVETPQAGDLARLLQSDTSTVTSTGPSRLTVSGLEAAHIGEIAAAHGVVLHQLTTQSASLEEAFMSLTADSVEYRSDAQAGAGSPTGRVSHSGTQEARS
ncbi:ABC transporter ATP-binding protein [Pseudactinotalea sp. HY158]|uniref:ABC transporter ATP-binding protein n=1 Tax=Pseudactinotalea sp. HY158 TaxID=2654547 RepID=UPI00129C27D9|nr:ABC transporter ATP-binding protein [Pseudactinotalea sp. HY158]QGH68710.1 ATP-binding cassette domain-containing protein [Pseudactinotalea sp. HY158]